MVLPQVSAVLPGVIDDNATIDLVRHYYNLSFNAMDICEFLFFAHHMIISKRSVERILRKFGLRRRGNESPVEDIVIKILEMQRLGYNDLGYKAMWKLLNTHCRLRVTQETTRHVLETLDPEGVRLRSRNCLRRREYVSKGPNFVIHLDGYDKLKPFGFAIHGAIDGFSRKILWLEVGPSNNNPRIVARYFINYLKEIKGAPRLTRCDAGTENSLVMCIQEVLRSYHTDSMNGQKSVSVGRSTANQRIEMLWSFLKRHFTQYWRNIFKDMIDSGKFNNADPIHIECLRFCFMPLIKQHLQLFKQSWNIHRIRSQRGGELIAGVPDILFYQPLRYGARDYCFQLPCDSSVLEDIEHNYTSDNPERGCSAEFLNLIELVTGEERDAFVSTNAQEAIHLYQEILNLIDHYSV